MLRKLLTNNNSDKDPANYVYRETDGYIKHLKNTHICFVVYMIAMTVLFYLAMGLWSIDFNEMFACDGFAAYYPKNLAGQFCNTVKNLTIMGFSVGINWFFWYGERMKKSLNFAEGNGNFLPFFFLVYRY